MSSLAVFAAIVTETVLYIHQGISWKKAVFSGLGNGIRAWKICSMTLQGIFCKDRQNSEPQVCGTNTFASWIGDIVDRRNTSTNSFQLCYTTCMPNSWTVLQWTGTNDASPISKFQRNIDPIRSETGGLCNGIEWQNPRLPIFWSLTWYFHSNVASSARSSPAGCHIITVVALKYNSLSHTQEWSSFLTITLC